MSTTAGALLPESEENNLAAIDANRSFDKTPTLAEGRMPKAHGANEPLAAPLMPAPNIRGRILTSIPGLVEAMKDSDLIGLDPVLDSVLRQIGQLEKQVELAPSADIHRQYDEAILHKILILKDLARKARRVLNVGVAGNTDAALISAYGSGILQQAIAESPIRITDTACDSYISHARKNLPAFVDSRDEREFIPESEIKKYADYMRGEIDKMIPGENAAQIAERLKTLFDRFMEKIRGKKIFTLPGIKGVLDLVDDPMIIAEIANEENFGDIIRLISVLDDLCKQRSLEKISGDETGHWPPEAQLIVAKQPELKSVIRELLAEGVDMQLKTKKRTEPRVLEAIRRVSVMSQSKFIQSWLPDLIRRGKRPKISMAPVALGEKEEVEDSLEEAKEKAMVATDEYRQARRQVEEGPEMQPYNFAGAVMVSRATRLLALEAEFAEKIAALNGKIEELIVQLQRFEGLDLEGDVDTIANGARDFKEVIALGLENLPPQKQERARQLIGELNAELKDINVEYGSRRLVFDDADERTSAAQKIIKSMLFVGPIAHGLESVDLGVIGKFFASSADDVMGEWAEMRGLIDSGFSVRSVLSRLKLATPVFLGASYGAFQVEHLARSGHSLQAGALFGLTAVALSLTTSVQSVRMFYECYDELVREGKISDKSFVFQNQPEFTLLAQRLEKKLDALEPAEIIKMVTDEMETIPDEVLSPEDKRKILAGLADMDAAGMADYFRKRKIKIFWQKLKEAIKQDFKNPARLGILVGACLAPVAGLSAGALGLLSNGLVLGAIGSVESAAAAGIVYLAGAINDLQYKTWLSKRLRQAGVKDA